jgi:hypothetical protein
MKTTKKEWRKPEVKRIAAGSAEVNTGTIDDGDPGSALNNS